MSAIDFAYEVIEMQQTIAELKRELYRLRDVEERYNTLMNESMAHSEGMMLGRGRPYCKRNRRSLNGLHRSFR
jgi:hypothetical protein